MKAPSSNAKKLVLSLTAVAVCTAYLIAAHAGYSFWTVLGSILLVGVPVAVAIWLIASNPNPRQRPYGYLALGSLFVFVLFVALPSQSNGLLIEGLFSWVVVSLLGYGVVRIYR
jgi:1,4-dihydroxy-2-naphthoate octaprenyltransferase